MAGAHAGELILPWVMAVERRLKLRAMAEPRRAVPDAERGQQTRGRRYYAPRLFGPRVRWLVRLLAKLG